MYPGFNFFTHCLIKFVKGPFSASYDTFIIFAAHKKL